MKILSKIIFWTEDDIKDALVWNGYKDSDENVELVNQYLEEELGSELFHTLNRKIEEIIEEYVED